MGLSTQFAVVATLHQSTDLLRTLQEIDPSHFGRLMELEPLEEADVSAGHLMIREHDNDLLPIGPGGEDRPHTLAVVVHVKYEDRPQYLEMPEDSALIRIFREYGAEVECHTIEV